MKGVTFDVRAGEIVGIAGVEGNGQRELIEALAGLVDPARVSGEMTLEGQPADRPRRPRRAASAASRTFPKIVIGAACCSTSRSRKTPFSACTIGRRSPSGVAGRTSAKCSGGPPTSSSASTCGRRTRRCRRERCRAATSRSSIIGREFALQPRLLLVAQPTRGVDIGAIEFIHRKLVALRDAGCAVLLVSAELEEVMSLSDRLLVIHDGRIAGEVDPASAPPATESAC